MAKFIPQRVFELAVTSVVKAHLDANVKVEAATSVIWEGYSKTYTNDHVETDLIFAANAAVDALNALDADTRATVLRNFQYYVANFEIDGSKRKKSFLGGMLLDRGRKNENRVKDFKRRLMIYQAGSKAGKMPVAPNDWSLS